MMILSFYVPSTAKEEVKKALFAAGAGRLGNYDQCAFEIKGIGQFRALEGANPTLGKLDQLEFVEEAKIEMVFEDKYLKEIVNALRLSHPYEEPAFHVLKCLEI